MRDHTEVKSDAARAALLHRWTRHRAIGAEHATVPRQRLEPFAAPVAVIEELAGIRGHLPGRLMAAFRAGDDRFLNHACGVLAGQLRRRRTMAKITRAVDATNMGTST